MNESTEKKNDTPLLSVIVPCFNEEEVINQFHLRLSSAIEKLGSNYEVIYVSDGSTDKTNELIANLVSNCKNNQIKFISFSRNFGHQIAVTAGIDYASGMAVVLIDADLQDPPELIHEMIQKWKEGYHVVYCQREKREGESLFKLISASLFYKVLTILSDVKIPMDTGDFRLIDRKVVDELKNMPEKDRFIRGMVSWVGFKQYALKYKRDERYAGVSKYPFWKMFRFAVDGILSFSNKPLRLATFTGFLSSFLSLIGIIYAIVMWITGVPVLGWTLMFIALLFFGGAQLITLGIIGEYIGRSYVESKRRPLYIIGEQLGFKSK